MTRIQISDRFGCLTILGKCPDNEQPGNGHIFYRVKCERCGKQKRQRSDRLRKCPTHCGNLSCRTMNGVDILERRKVERQLWETIQHLKKDNPTWHYLWGLLKNDDRWDATGLQDVTPLNMKKWYYRVGKLLRENK